jgi:hypothetical protein
MKDSCWTKESSQHSLVSSSWISHIGLWITTALSHELLLNELLMLNYGIITTLSHELLFNEWLILDYGIPTSLSREYILNGSRYAMESAQHSHVSSSWISHVALWNHHSIITWTPPELSRFEYGILKTLSRGLLLNEWLMLEYEIITAFCHEDLISVAFSRESLALWIHHRILTWTPSE